MELWTLGHSTRTLEFTVGLLLGYDIEHLVDIRSFPRSLHNPQFNQDTLALNLEAVDIRYTHYPQLGGLRKPKPDSINGGWKNSGFRGFADYMQTDAFAVALSGLVEIAHRETTAFMCSEAVPWRCHRSLVSDALTVRKVPVYHIMSRVTASLHILNPLAHVDEIQITYPPAK